MRTASRAASRSRGVSLIEVLVSLVVFSFGVLGLVGLQGQAIRVSVQAGERSRAALMANEAVAALWAARSTTLDETQLAAWQARVADEAGEGLHEGEGRIGEADSDGTVTITITWTSVARGSEGAPGRYLTQVALAGVSTP